MVAVHERPAAGPCSQHQSFLSAVRTSHETTDNSVTEVIHRAFSVFIFILNSIVVSLEKSTRNVCLFVFLRIHNSQLLILPESKMIRSSDYPAEVRRSLFFLPFSPPTSNPPCLSRKRQVRLDPGQGSGRPCCPSRLIQLIQLIFPRNQPGARLGDQGIEPSQNFFFLLSSTQIHPRNFSFSIEFQKIPPGSILPRGEARHCPGRVSTFGTDSSRRFGRKPQLKQTLISGDIVKTFESKISTSSSSLSLPQ